METAPDPFTDPSYRDAVLDLLGLLCVGELDAFSRLAADAELAPTIKVKAEFAALAVAEFEHYQLLVARLVELGSDPDATMKPFAANFDAFHARTRPSTWLEGVVKAYVGDGIASDFYLEIARYVDPRTRSLIEHVLADQDRAEFLVRVAKEGMRADRQVSGRLALWARRLLGEAVSQAQVVAVERDSLTRLLAGGDGRPGADLAEMGAMFTRITDAHTRRMGALGLMA